MRLTPGQCPSQRRTYEADSWFDPEFVIGPPALRGLRIVSMSDLRYPIGKWGREPVTSDAQRRTLLDQIAAEPANLRAAVTGLSETQLDTHYRPGGWSVRQVVHHVPDSHMNAFIRFKLALTEDEPLIKTYEEQKWAELPDVKQTPVETSLALLERLHERWVRLMRATPAELYARRFRHPEIGPMTLDDLISMYSWHGRHHTAHITSLRERMGW